MDGLDGLVSGFSLLVVSVTFFVGYHATDKFLMILSISLMGSLIGFLKFNAFPARIFLGDTGSQSLGFFLVSAAMIASLDIFKPEFNYKLFIDAFIRRNFTNHPLFEDPDFRAWLEQEDFRIFTVRRDGITFSTKFNILYGRVHITVPYTELEPFITKSSAVRTVMQHTYGIVLPEIKWPAFLKKKKKQE